TLIRSSSQDYDVRLFVGSLCRKLCRILEEKRRVSTKGADKVDSGTGSIHTALAEASRAGLYPAGFVGSGGAGRSPGRDRRSDIGEEQSTVPASPLREQPQGNHRR